MEFWGVEVKAGETLKVHPGDDYLLHLSQAALGESKKDKGADSVPLFVKFGKQKLVLGTLSAENCPQLSFDLVFEKEFELSHNWKNGSVYFAGYKSGTPEDDEISDSDFSDSDSEDVLPLAATENGKPEPLAAKAKPAVKVVEPASDDKDEDSDSDFEDSDDTDEVDSDEDMGDAESDDEDDSEEDEETPTPKKALGNKKRQAESEAKTPVSAKKAKAGTPQKSDVKPSGQASKTPNADKLKTPKSGGDISCKSCSKTFKSEHAMEAHSKAKHSGGK